MNDNHKKAYDFAEKMDEAAALIDNVSHRVTNFLVGWAKNTRETADNMFGESLDQDTITDLLNDLIRKSDPTEE